MISTETINKAIRDIISSIIGGGFTVIKAKQPNAPRPPGPYADVDMISTIGIGWEQREFENNELDEDMMEHLEGMAEMGMSINFYRDSAEDNARKFRVALIRESTQEALAANGIGIVRRSDVREISKLLDATWEERAQMDLFINIIDTDADLVRSILTVDIDSDIQ